MKQNFSFFFLLKKEFVPRELKLILNETNQICLLTNQSNNSTSSFAITDQLLNLKYTPNDIYHSGGVAYDYYSIPDLGKENANCLWKNWPLPHEINRNFSLNKLQLSTNIPSKLPFVEQIYVLTDSSFIERHTNLRKALLRQGISTKYLNWRFKWNYTTCNSNSSFPFVRQQLNLKEPFLGM